MKWADYSALVIDLVSLTNMAFSRHNMAKRGLYPHMARQITGRAETSRLALVNRTKQ